LPFPTYSLNIDYALYKKFWQLQDFFRWPTQCYERLKWKTFTTYSKDVLNTFESFKLDAAGSSSTSSAATTDESSQQRYFAKYLTNQNLLQLQLSDSNFRRYVLVQFLVLFQYLQSSVKFKTEAEALTEEQARWVKVAGERVHKLIRETPPDGEQFDSAVKHVLDREKQWNAWKNEGCPKFDRAETAKEAMALREKSDDKDKKKGPLRNNDLFKWVDKPLLFTDVGVRKNRVKLGDQLRQATADKKFLLGNPHLTKLWNLCPDNLEAW